MTNLSYKLCKRLKDAGFSQIGDGKILCEAQWYAKQNAEHILCDHAKCEEVYFPTLSEIIYELGGRFGALLVGPGLLYWTARGHGVEVRGESPEEAVANLWLKLNEK